MCPAGRELREKQQASWFAALSARSLAVFVLGLHPLGKLKPDLTPSEFTHTEELLPASPTERSGIPAQLSAEDHIFIASISVPLDRRMKIALIEAAQGDPYLFADVNLNGKFDASERFQFAPPSGHSLLKYPEAILKVQLKLGPYSHYPVRVLLPETRILMMNRDGKGGRLLLRSPVTFVEGTVKIGGAPVLAMYEFDANRIAAYPDFGWLGMDVNGDGWIDERANQEELTHASDESVLFRVNGRDVSTVSVDVTAGTFELREHPAGDNKRIILQVGDVVPDFSFSDLDGKPHRLSEFQGKYILLDFWGTWCGPCRRELPDLEKAYQQFRSRGLVILGMDDEKDTEKAKKALADAGVTYPQSGGEVGNALVYRKFRISRFPTKALLSPERRILALDSDGSFDREHLLSTLDKLLPQPE